jgi:hypothetical protein
MDHIKEDTSVIPKNINLFNSVTMIQTKICKQIVQEKQEKYG